MKLTIILQLFIKILIFVLCAYLIHFFIMVNINKELNHLKKSDVLNYIRDDSLDFITIDKNNVDINLIKALKYPIIFKPDYCCDFAHAVEVVKNCKEAIDYINRSIDSSIIVQEYHPGPYEATIFYRKNPYTKNSSIVVSERVNENAKKDFWIWKSSISYKYNFHNVARPDLETSLLKEKMDKISNKIPSFYYGRYDIRFRNYADLKLGKGFKIIELNSFDSGETRRDPRNSTLYNLSVFSYWFIERYKYGVMNILRGNICSADNYIKLLKTNLTKVKQCKQEDKIQNAARNIFISIFPV